MPPLRVLIIDGTSTTRQLLSRVLRLDVELEVVGAVSTGTMALARWNDWRPDIVLLDIAADQEGLRTLGLIRESEPKLPILIFSVLAQRGSQITLDALALGATGYVSKTANFADLERCVTNDLIPKIKAVAQSSSRELAPSQLQMRAAGRLVQVAAPATRSSAEIVAIATSTGGPNALATVLSSLPASFSTPVVIVQHMASGFTTTLAESLRRQTSRDVREVDSIQPLTAAPIWLAPGGRHLIVVRDGAMTQVKPDDSPPENDCRPSADVLFRSVAEVFGARCLAVVLTGMGCDGLAGCHTIRQAGGQIVVQDEASSIAWGMPGQVATAGLADAVLPLTDIAQEIVRRTSNAPRTNRR